MGTYVLSREALTMCALRPGKDCGIDLGNLKCSPQRSRLLNPEMRSEVEVETSETRSLLTLVRWGWLEVSRESQGCDASWRLN